MSEEQKKQTTRPRDENFDVAESRSAKGNEGPAEIERRKQSPWVVMAIIAAGVVLAFISVLVYHLMKTNQRSVISLTPGGSTEETTAPLPAETQETTLNEVDETGDPGEQTESAPSGETEEETSAEPEYDQTVGDLVFHIGKGYASVKKCKAAPTVLEIPSEVDGWQVRAIWNNAFDGCVGIQYLKVPEGVATIGEYAFANMGEVKEFVLPSSVFDIQAHCFDYTGGMTFIVKRGSYAEKVAVSAGIPVINGDRFTIDP